MNKDELKELADNPNHISGIYNYCDRWCERCAFTSRCFLYATEQTDPDMADPEVQDVTNAKFWNKLREVFQATSEMISEWAAEAGVDLQSINVTEDMADHERRVNNAKQDELSKAARDYANSVETWFETEFDEEGPVYTDTRGSSSDDEDLRVNDAIGVIRWYQFFIAAKTFRALASHSRFAEDDTEEDDLEDDLSFDFTSDAEDDDTADYEAIAARAARVDANGSAKIALVAIDRSMAAWRALQIALAEKTDTIKPLLIDLDRMRRSLESRFPRARDFIRPGFDEQFSEFVS
jgi:hypothetical protein